jgi:outer membrane beta-barrel protein
MRAFLLATLLCGAAAAQPVDPDVRVHVLEKRPFTEAQRWEVSFFGSAQVNPKFTEHAGISVEVAYHLRENFAAQLGLLWFPYAVQSGLSEQLLTRAGEAPEAASSFLVRGALLAGVELMPVYGKLDVFDGRILRLGFYLNAGLGAVSTRLQLRPSSDPTTGRTFGDTGYRPAASLGAGLRVFMSDRFTIRLELRDLAYSGYVSRVNGCNYDDTVKIESAEAAGTTATGLSGGCNERAFGSAGTVAQLNAGAAKDLLKNPSADVINNVAFQGGVSWLF